MCNIQQESSDMLNYALQKLALESIRHELYNGWKNLDKIAGLWKSTHSCKTFTNFATTWFIRHNRAEYEEKYHDLRWAMDNLPRYMLQRWCNEHDFDFFTVCRVIDDKEIFV